MNALDIMKALGNVPAEMIGACCVFPADAEDPDSLPAGTAQQQILPFEEEVLPQTEKRQIRAAAFLPAAVSAACLLFAVGFGYLILHSDTRPETAESLDPAQTTTAAPVSEAADSTVLQTAAPHTTALPAGTTGTTAKTVPRTTTATQHTAPAVPAVQTAAETAAAVHTTGSAAANTARQSAQTSANTTTRLHTTVSTAPPHTTAASTTTETETVTTASVPAAPPQYPFRVMFATLFPEKHQLYRAEFDGLPDAVFTLERFYAYEELPDRLWVTSHGDTKLICEGSPITDIIADDLNGDGMPELCIETVSDEYYEPNIDCTVLVYEHSRQKTFTLGEKGDPLVGGYYVYAITYHFSDRTEPADAWHVQRRIFYPPYDSEYHDKQKTNGRIVLNGDTLEFIETGTP